MLAKIICSFVFWGTIISGTPGFGAAFVEKHGDMSLDWGAMRLSFRGEARPSTNEEIDYAALSDLAWTDGLKRASATVQQLHSTHYSRFKGVALPNLEQESHEAAEKVTTSTYSRNTTYFDDGLVRVDLENSLARALGLYAVSFRGTPQPESVEFSGVVFQVPRSIRPMAVFEIVDEKGMQLFSWQGMNANVFTKSLMGRWFQPASSGEVRRYAGEKPINIRALKVLDGRITVSGTEWLKYGAELAGHVSQGRAVFSMK